MPKLYDKLTGTQESTGGFSDIEPGAYKLRIMSVEPHDKDEYFTITWDVADGPSKGIYAKSNFPPSERIYWRDSTMGFLKMKLHRISLCNPGRFHELLDKEGKFASLKEFEEDNWKAFEGAYFAAVVRRRLYTAGPGSKNPGADRTSIEIAKWLTPDEFKSKSWSESLLKDNDQRDRDSVAQRGSETVAPPENTEYKAPDLYEEDIPF